MVVNFYATGFFPAESTHLRFVFLKAAYQDQMRVFFRCLFLKQCLAMLSHMQGSVGQRELVFFLCVLTAVKELTEQKSPNQNKQKARARCRPTQADRGGIGHQKVQVAAS